MAERDLTEIDWLPKLNAYCRQVGHTSKSSISQQTPDMNKPSYSYGTLIRMAINSTSERKMSLAEIYKWVVTHFSYYRHAGRSWKNSIRHNLSMSKHFIKVPRAEDDPGKGCYWTVDLSPERLIPATNQAPPSCATMKSKRKRQTLAVPPYCPEKYSNDQKQQVEQYYPATSAPTTFYHNPIDYNSLPGCGSESITREYQEFPNYHYTKDFHLNTFSLGPSSSSIIESAARSAGILLDEFSNKNVTVATETYDFNSEINTLQEISHSTYMPVSLEFNEMHLEPSAIDIDFDWDLLIN